MSLQKHLATVLLINGAIGSVARFQKAVDGLLPPQFRLLKMGSAFWQSRALHAIAALDVATLLGDSAQSVSQLSGSTRSDPDALVRLLRFLRAMGIFEEISPGVFRNNKTSNALRRDSQSNVRAMVLMHNCEQMTRPWTEQLIRGVKGEGVPFELVNGSELFMYMSADANFDALFAEAMDCAESLTGTGYALDFDWGDFERVFDIGGSKGHKTIAVLRQHARLRAVVVDRPSVVEQAKRFWGSRDDPILTRVRFQEGDVLTAVPPAETNKDVYFLSAVLHAFDDERCLLALRNLATATGNTGARIVLNEWIRPESKEDLIGTLADIQLFVGTRGRERTLKEWKALFDASQLALVEVVQLRGLGKMMVLRGQ